MGTSRASELEVQFLGGKKRLSVVLQCYLLRITLLIDLSANCHGLPLALRAGAFSVQELPEAR